MVLSSTKSSDQNYHNIISKCKYCNKTKIYKREHHIWVSNGNGSRKVCTKCNEVKKKDVKQTTTVNNNRSGAKLNSNANQCSRGGNHTPNYSGYCVKCGKRV